MKKPIYMLSVVAILLSIPVVAGAYKAQYTYDYLHRLSQVDYGNGYVVQYRYDNNGNRIRMTFPHGSLFVDIRPQAAADAGAEWKLDSGGWQTNEATAYPCVGQHTVAFSRVVGWKTPGSQSVAVSNGQSLLITATYVQPAATLTVALSPQGAIDAGAKWRVDAGSWENSGAIVSNLSIGNHTVSFKNITGWNPPANETASITNDKPTYITGDYVQQTGSVSVTISPAAAISAGAGWDVDGGSRQNSGANVSNLGVGNHTISFVAVSGWKTPDNQTVSVTYGQTTHVTGTYAQQLNGACGSSSGASFTSAPTSNLCSSGEASSVSGSGPWTWTCQGTNGGTDASCSADLEVNGACGSANGQAFSTAPASNLCSAGTASAVTGAGPWTWICMGANGGTYESCSAKLSSTGSLWQNAVATGGGWYYLSPFGAFNTNASPWIYHYTLGWLYPVGTSTESIWFYDPQWDGAGGWWWTSSSFFPWLYSATEKEWLYYDAKDSSPTARWFFSADGQASVH